MPRPANADIRCSTVETRTSPSTGRARAGIADVFGIGADVDDRLEIDAAEHDAGIDGAGRNIM